MWEFELVTIFMKRKVFKFLFIIEKITNWLQILADPNGGKTPRWNRVFHTQLASGVNKIFIEIYDECNFTMDELIAWTEVKIPDVVIERGMREY